MIGFSFDEHIKTDIWFWFVCIVHTCVCLRPDGRESIVCLPGASLPCKLCLATSAYFLPHLPTFWHICLFFWHICLFFGTFVYFLAHLPSFWYIAYFGIQPSFFWHICSFKKGYIKQLCFQGENVMGAFYCTFCRLC